MLTTWCLVIGLLLIGMGLTDTVRRDLPLSSAALYLLAGWLIGPQVLGLVHLDLFADARLIEVLTEAAVLISLFAVGLRLRVRLTDRLWLTPVLLATVAMLLTIGALAATGFALGLSIGAALLLAAVLAPTDPVLASDVQVDNPGDRDRLRFSLSGEGGLNDGTAFPFVMLALGALGLHDLGEHALRWWGVDLLWAVAGALVIGWMTGWAFSRAVLHLRRQREQAFGMESFLTLGLIALTYGLALAAHTYGFLAVFVAGLAMRAVEYVDSGRRESVPPADSAQRDTSAYMARAVLDFTLDIERLAELAVMLLIGALLSATTFSAFSLGIAAALLFVVRPLAVRLTLIGSPLTRTQRRLAAWFGIRGIGSAYMARAVLDFTLDIERLAELAVMLLVGALLSATTFSAFSLGIAAALLFVVRPLAVRLTLIGSPLTRTQRRLAAWFGIRGIGSAYYLAYALSHGAKGEETAVVADAVLATIVASVLLHGASATPVMRLYRRARRGSRADG